MTYLKVDGHTSLVRDEKTNAILNTNTSDYENYMKLKKLKENESKRVESLESDINNIKSDLEEIKTLLRNLSNGS
jgi:K+/H+ antiporter YhaU regulatory subunit KhtT